MNNVNAPDTAAASTEYFKPLFSFSPSASSFNPSSILPIVFLIVVLIWLAYTVAAAYHWFRYGRRSWVAVPALGVHVFVSGILIVYMMTGL